MSSPGLTKACSCLVQSLFEKRQTRSFGATTKRCQRLLLGLFIGLNADNALAQVGRLSGPEPLLVKAIARQRCQCHCHKQRR